MRSPSINHYRGDNLYPHEVEIIRNHFPQNTNFNYTMRNITNETESANFDRSIEIEGTIDLEALFNEIEQIKENEKASKTIIDLKNSNGVYSPQQDWDLSEIFGEEENELTSEELTTWMLEN